MSTTHSIAVIGGDGIGPEVTAEALKVLRAAGAKHDIAFETTDYPFGGAHWKRTGETLPDSALEELRGHDAILLGAVGDPTTPPGVLEQGILLRMRFALDLYINLRPIQLLPGVQSPLRDRGPEDIDIVIVRENTQDVYIGAGGTVHEGTRNAVALQQVVETHFGIDRCVRYAFETARQRGGPLHLCDKANVLTHAHGLWRRIFAEVAAENPDIETGEVLVDAMCMYLVSQPDRFRTVVTTNMFGDIIADLGAGIVGGMGFAASANLNPDGVSMFEPVHGSAPDIAGQGKANPIAAILSAALLLDTVGHPEAGDAVRAAVNAALSEGRIDLSPRAMTTSQIGDLIAESLA
jgi:3-isopropylmalate dehydrogenase